MKTVYKDSNHFNEETFIQAKFFKMSVNTYRKGIAKRYGYKSVKLFKDFLDNVNKTNQNIIYVIATEDIGTIPTQLKFKYFNNENDSNIEFEKIKEKQSPPNQQQIFQYSFLEDEVDKRHDYINAEKQYPFNKDIWIQKVKEKEQKTYLNKPINKIWDMTKKAWGDEWIPENNIPTKHTVFTFCVELKADYENAEDVIKTLGGHILSKKEIDGFQTDFTFELNNEITETDLKNKIKDIVLSNKKMCDMKYFYLTVKSGFVSQDDFVY